MAKFMHADVLDNGLNYIKNNCNSMVCIANYTFGDTYATVTGGSNILAQVSMSPSDFTNGSNGTARTLTTAAAKQDSSANNSGTATHIAFLDTTTSKVLWVTEETSNQYITAGNPVIFPSLVATAPQPVAP